MVSESKTTTAPDMPLSPTDSSLDRQPSEGPTGPALNRHAYNRLLSRMKKAKKKKHLEAIAKENSEKKKVKKRKRDKIAKKSRKNNRKK